MRLCRSSGSSASSAAMRRKSRSARSVRLLVCRRYPRRYHASTLLGWCSKAASRFMMGARQCQAVKLGQARQVLRQADYHRPERNHDLPAFAPTAAELPLAIERRRLVVEEWRQLFCMLGVIGEPFDAEHTLVVVKAA